MRISSAHLLGGLLTCSLLASAASAQQTCVTLKSEAHIEERYTDAQGKPATRLVAPAKVVPGNEVIWTITANNSCDKPAERVVVENSIPEHMTYIANSAMGPGTDITFSLDGREFKKQSELTVRDADGTTRVARADEIKRIRWVLTVPIQSKSQAFARYRAQVK